MIRKIIVSCCWLLFSITAINLVGCGIDRAEVALAMKNDRGIGGTGTPLLQDERGIGGTGIIGTITEFGSIWVNGLEIELDAKTQISLDGKPAAEKHLRLGQQVAVLAHVSEGIWYADKVIITLAITGIVQEITKDEMIINGVTLKPDTNMPGKWPEANIGDKLSISGYFDNGKVYVTDAVASNNNDKQWHITGPVELNQSGYWAIAENVVIPDKIITTQKLKLGDTVTVEGHDQSITYKKNSIPFHASRYLIEHRAANGTQNIELLDPRIFDRSPYLEKEPITLQSKDEISKEPVQTSTIYTEDSVNTDSSRQDSGTQDISSTNESANHKVSNGRSRNSEHSSRTKAPEHSSHSGGPGNNEDSGSTEGSRGPQGLGSPEKLQ